MRCAEFNERFHQLLDRRLPLAGDPALVAHAAGCAACRQQMQAWDALDTVLSDEDRPSPPPELAARVLSEVAPAAPSLRRGVPLAAWVTAAAALAAVLLVGLTVLLTQHDSPTANVATSAANAPSQEPGAVSSRPTPLAVAGAQPDPAVSPDPEFDPQAADYTQLYEYLSQEGRQSPFLHQSTWVEPMSATVRPITTSFQTAIDHPVPRPIATTFTTAFQAVRSSEPQQPVLPPGPQSSLLEPTEEPQALQPQLHTVAQLG